MISLFPFESEKGAQQAKGEFGDSNTHPHAGSTRTRTNAETQQQRRVVQGDTSKSIDVRRYRYTRRWGPGERIPPSRIKGSINTIIYKQNQTKPCYYCKKSSLEISSSMDASIIGPSVETPHACSPNMYLYLDHTTFYRVDLVGTTDY